MNIIFKNYLETHPLLEIDDENYIIPDNGDKIVINGTIYEVVNTIINYDNMTVTYYVLPK